MTPDSRPIMVAVGPTEVGEAALDYTAAEVARRGCAVRLVHVVPPLLVAPPDFDRPWTVDRELTRVGAQLSRAAASLRRRLSRDVDVTTELDWGPVVRTLVARSEHASLVVLQLQPTGRWEHIVTSSVSNGVAARAHAPVAAVPHEWRAASTPAGWPVVVGVHESGSVAEVRAGLALAAERGVPARLVHAWWVAEVYEGALLQARDKAGVSAELTEAIETGLAGLLAEYPQVKAEVSVVHGHPADVLVEAAAEAQLLVLARHHPLLPLGSHLGPVTRSVLRHSPSPVLVVDPAAQAAG